MSKLLLVIPNTRWFGSTKWDLYPYNVCLLAAVLKPEREVEILDCNANDLSLEEAVHKISESKPNYIGISCLAVEYSRQAHELAVRIKAVSASMPVILGGVYCTLLPELAMSNPAIDYCVLGEGEPVLRPLLESIEQNKLPEHLDGVAFKKDGQLIIKPQRELIKDLDSLPLPALDLVDFCKYGWAEQQFSFTDTRDAVPVAKVYTSRGCPVGCNFCAVEKIAGSTFRGRSVKSVLREMQFLKQTYGVKEIVFYDDNLLFDSKRAKELCLGIIDEKLDLKLKAANVAIYRLDKELLDLMWRAGFTTLVFAIESANSRVLHEIMGKKPLKIEKARGIVDYANSLGFRCAALFVIGNPGETWDEIRNTFTYAEDLGIYCHFSIATPLPKTKLYEEALRSGCLTEDFSFAAGAGCSRGWLVTEEFTPFDVEVLRAYEWDRINFGSPEKRARAAAFFKVTAEEVAEFARNGRKTIQERYVQEPYKRLS
jgi:radical SAM superfamily enzyme YgiQ (UPF0313 family)